MAVVFDVESGRMDSRMTQISLSLSLSLYIYIYICICYTEYKRIIGYISPRFGGNIPEKCRAEWTL